MINHDELQEILEQSIDWSAVFKSMNQAEIYALRRAFEGCYNRSVQQPQPQPVKYVLCPRCKKRQIPQAGGRCEKCRREVKDEK